MNRSEQFLMVMNECQTTAVGQESGLHRVTAGTIIKKETCSEFVNLDRIIDDHLSLPSHVKIIDVDGRLACTDGQSDAATWLRVVSISKDCQSHNIELTNTRRGLLLRAVKLITPGEPLSLWFDEVVLSLLSIKPLNPLLNIRANNPPGYVCDHCDAQFDYPNPLKIHLAFDCQNQKTQHIESNAFWRRLVREFRPPSSEPFSVILSKLASPTKPRLVPTSPSSPGTDLSFNTSTSSSGSGTPSSDNSFTSNTSTSPPSINYQVYYQNLHQQYHYSPQVVHHVMRTSSPLASPRRTPSRTPSRTPTAEPYSTPPPRPTSGGGKAPNRRCSSAFQPYALSPPKNNPSPKKPPQNQMPVTVPRVPQQTQIHPDHIFQHLNHETLSTALPLTAECIKGLGEPQVETVVSNMGRTNIGHVCIWCGKVYSRKYGLKIHIRTHTGYKPLKCKYCERPFGDPSNLNKHVRLHAEGTTPYKCDLCGKILVRRRDLERHMRSRHPSVPSLSGFGTYDLTSDDSDEGL